MSHVVLPNYRFSRYYKRLDPLIKNRRNQAYTLVVLSLLTISFFGFFAVRPTLKTIASLRKQIEDRTLLNTQLEEKINALINAQENYQQIEARLPLVYSLLPHKAEFPRLLRHLELLADSNNATISSIQFEPVVVYAKDGVIVDATDSSELEQKDESTAIADPATPIPFTLSVKGTYEELMSFLRQLTQLERIITLEAMDLTLENTGAAAENMLTLSIKAKAYYLPQKETAQTYE